MVWSGVSWCRGDGVVVIAACDGGGDGGTWWWCHRCCRVTVVVVVTMWCGRGMWWCGCSRHSSAVHSPTLL